MVEPKLVHHSVQHNFMPHYSFLYVEMTRLALVSRVRPIHRTLEDCIIPLFLASAKIYFRLLPGSVLTLITVDGHISCCIKS
jgi:hypothetical protein